MDRRSLWLAVRLLHLRRHRLRVCGRAVLRAARTGHCVDGRNDEERYTTARGAGVIFATPGYQAVLTVFAIASICDWAIYTWMPLYLFESFHFSLAKAGFTATFYIKAGGFVGLLLGGMIADAWATRTPRGRVWTQSVGLLCAAPCLIASGMTKTPLLLYAAMLIFGVGKGMYDGNTMPVLCDGIPSQLRATAFGFLNFAGTFAGGVVAALAGALKATIGLGGTFLACGVILAIAGLLMTKIRMHRSAPEQSVALSM